MSEAIKKVCTKCHQEREIRKFYMDRKKGKMFTACMDCTTAAARQRYYDKIAITHPAAKVRVRA